MKTKVIDVKTTRSGYIHFIDGDGNTVVKIKSGDAVAFEYGKLYVCRNEAIEAEGGDIHFDSRMSVAVNGLEWERFCDVVYSPGTNLYVWNCHAFMFKPVTKVEGVVCTRFKKINKVKL